MFLSQNLTQDEMKKYKCPVCGYVYDPVEGDSDNHVHPGTSFDDLPNDWLCPVCSVPKEEFEPVE
jgi:rubredoxin